MASLPARNWISWPSRNDTNSIGSPVGDTIRSVSPTTVKRLRRIGTCSPSCRPLPLSASSSSRACCNGRPASRPGGWPRPPITPKGTPDTSTRWSRPATGISRVWKVAFTAWATPGSWRMLRSRSSSRREASAKGPRVCSSTTQRSAPLRSIAAPASATMPRYTPAIDTVTATSRPKPQPVTSSLPPL